MRRTSGVLALACALVALVRCAPNRVIDDDDTCSKAKPLPPIVIRQDSLNVTLGDRSDCSLVKYFKDALAKVEFRIGTAFEHHNLKGIITVYDQDGQVLDQRPVDPSLFKYNFEFEVKAQKAYYVEFKATEGGYDYAATVNFGPLDPCARCTTEEECVEGKCRAKEKVCEPACDEEEGLICEEGKCVPACNPECRKGFRCDIEEKKCVAKGVPCVPACKKDFRCDYRNGTCRPKTVVAGCAGGCKAGEVCKDSKCVSLTEQKCPPCPNPTDVCSRETNFKCLSAGDDPNSGPIIGSVISTQRSGEGSFVYINRGERHGVRANLRGKLCGKHGFVIMSVFPTRSKAKTNASLEEIGECKSVVIPR